MGKGQAESKKQPKKAPKNKPVAKDNQRIQSISKDILNSLRQSNFNQQGQKIIEGKSKDKQDIVDPNSNANKQLVTASMKKQSKEASTKKTAPKVFEEEQKATKKKQKLVSLKDQIIQTIKANIQKEKEANKSNKKQQQPSPAINPVVQSVSSSEMDSKQLVEGRNLFEEIYSSSEQEQKQEKNKKVSVSILKNQRMEQQNNLAHFNKPVSQVKKQLHKSEKKRVSFGEVQFVQFQPDRKWDFPVQQERKGKFTPQQHKKLIASLHTYLSLNNLTFQQLRSMLIQDDQDEVQKQKKRKIWTTICSAVPNRSIRSCYRYLKRQLDQKNYKGSWDKEEQEQLLLLIQKYGRKWSKIGKQMQRTPDNIRDKYRQMGQEKNEDISQGMWAFKELVQFLKLIKRQTHVDFLNLDIDIQAQKAQQHDNKQKIQYKQRKYNSKKFIFHNNSIVSLYINSHQFQKIDTSKLKWHRIAEKLTTRTPIQCKNKFVQLMEINYKQTVSFQTDEHIVKFLVAQNVQTEDLIKWNEWDSSNGIDALQALNRWKIMKKHIEGRMRKSFRQVLLEVHKSIKRKQQGKYRRPKISVQDSD